MKLVYKETGKEVKIGDNVTLSDGENVRVTFFRPPHKPSSSGKVSVRRENSSFDSEYYISVIVTEWIEREDR